MQEGSEGYVTVSLGYAHGPSTGPVFADFLQELCSRGKESSLGRNWEKQAGI